MKVEFYNLEQNGKSKLCTVNQSILFNYKLLHLIRR